MARYSTSLDVGKEIESDPVKPMNPAPENEEQITLDEVQPSEEEEFLEQKRAKKTAHAAKQATKITDDSEDDVNAEATTANYAKRFMEMDEETEDEVIDRVQDQKDISDEAEPEEQAIETLENKAEQKEIPSEQEEAVQQIIKKPQKQIHKTEKQEQYTERKTEQLKEEKHKIMQKQDRSEEKNKDVTSEEQGISWTWVIALLVFIIIAALAWKYWPTTAAQILPVSVQAPAALPALQNSTLSNNTPAQPQEPASADDALAGLSDRLKG